MNIPRLRPGHYAILIAWICAIGLAILQGHFFLSGYRLTGDEVLFEDIILRGRIAGYIADTAAQQGRMGLYLLMPLLLAGTHFADYLGFRIFYVLLWYADILLFSVWIARIAGARVALPVFVAVVAMQPMIGYHMPPVGYPLELGLPLLVMLGTRLFFLAQRPPEPHARSMALQLCIYATCVVYALAALSSEYMMIMAVVMPVAECCAQQTPGQTLRGATFRLKAYRRDIVIVVTVYLMYAFFRQSQPTHYDGASLDGLANVRDLLHTFFMHIATGTWLPFFDWSILTPSVERSAILAATLCGMSLAFHGWSRRTVRLAAGKPAIFWLPAAALAVGAIAITLPVVAASKQQHWCIVDHNCSYLDSRISMLLMTGAVALAGLSLCSTIRMRISFRIVVFLALVSSSVFGYAVNFQQTQGMKIAAAAWTRARAIACVKLKFGMVATARYIDPDHYIPMHSVVDRDLFWNDYTNRLAREGRCTASPPAQSVLLTDKLSTGIHVAVRLDAAGLGYLGQGWSHPEPGGVWSDGESASLHVRIASSYKALKMVLMLQAFGPAKSQTQHVTVEIDGVSAALWNVSNDAAEPYEVDIPAAILRAGGEVNFLLRISQPVSPSELHMSSDTRRLGVYLSDLELRPTTIAQPH